MQGRVAGRERYQLSFSLERRHEHLQLWRSRATCHVEIRADQPEVKGHTLDVALAAAEAYGAALSEAVEEHVSDQGIMKQVCKCLVDWAQIAGARARS